MLVEIKKAALIIALAMGVMQASSASVIINRTRVIFPSSEKEVSVQLTNMDEVPKVVQAWIDSGNKELSPDLIDVPFQILSPVFRMNAKKGQVLRLIGLPNSLPQDKESVFYLNVLEVPPTPDLPSGENFVQFSFRSRIKLFYRPQSLSGVASNAGEKIEWQISEGQLVAKNPTPYYVSMNTVEVLDFEGGGKPGQIDMLAPFSEMSVSFQEDKSVSAKNVKFIKYSYIDDLGAVRELKGHIK